MRRRAERILRTQRSQSRINGSWDAGKFPAEHSGQSIVDMIPAGLPSADGPDIGGKQGWGRRWVGAKLPVNGPRIPWGYFHRPDVRVRLENKW